MPMKLLSSLVSRAHSHSPRHQLASVARSDCKSIASTPSVRCGAGRLDASSERILDHSHTACNFDRELQEFYVTCHPGLEQVVANELCHPSIAARHVVPLRAGVSFQGKLAGAGYRANLWLRSAIRVLVKLSAADLDLAAGPSTSQSSWHSGNVVYEWAKSAACWEELLVEGGSFSVDVRLHSCTGLTNSKLAATRIKDAICDRLRDAGRGKPDPPPRGSIASLPLYVTLYQDRATLYRDMSGDSLHRRGYRGVVHKAALNEAAAAGLLQLAGWPSMWDQEDVVLTDPMCGSGTFLVEGVLMALGVAPNISRNLWPFTQWPDFDAQGWREAMEQARAAPRKWRGRAMGCDVNEGALELCHAAAEAAGVRRYLNLSHSNCAQWSPPARPTFVISNPPWGNRLLPADEDQPQRGRSTPSESHGGARERTELEETWFDLGVFIKAHCVGSQVHLLSGNAEVTRKLGLKAERKLPITLSDIDARLLYYPMPEGGRKGMKGGRSDVADERTSAVGSVGKGSKQHTNKRVRW